MRELLSGCWSCVRLVVIAAIALVAGWPAGAFAHQSSIKYLDVTVDGTHATLKMTVAPSDVTEPLELPPDARPSVAEAIKPVVALSVSRWVLVRIADGAPACPVDEPAIRPDVDGRFVVVEWRAECGTDLSRFNLDFAGFFRVDARHEAVVAIHAPGTDGDTAVVRSTDPVLRVRAGESLSFTGWIASGVAHIWEGRDHVSFVLVLLFVVVLIPVGGVPGSWHLRQGGPTLRTAATIVTAFTLAHSLTLVAASLGWIRLPSRLVESLIAFSILYTALENIARPSVRWRFWLTFGFGLIHGLGFASVLEELLPPDDLIMPLVGFNLGVELGQLVIVAVALPLVWLLARWLGADRYRRWLMPALSGAIAVVAVKWLAERTLDLTLPTVWGM